MLVALTRKPSPSLEACELSYISRQPIDFAKAWEQHDAYEAMLTGLGAHVIALPADPEHPDSVFLEDPAVVLDEIAIIGRPGAASRLGEASRIAEALAGFRELRRIEAPATLEGGDVIVAGKTLYAGLSGRTNRAGIEQLKTITAPLGYRVVPLTVNGCLHLKTACAYLGGETFLAQRAWVDLSPLEGAHVLEVRKEEPWGANVLVMGTTVVIPDSAPRTAELLAHAGFGARCLDISEFQKAEAGVTCLSLLFSG